jgi:hypothetical protein
MGKPRIDPAHYLDPTAVKAGSHEGEWVRVTQYSKGHKVGANGVDAQCGHPLVVDLDWWARFRNQLDRDPGVWYIAEDHRVEDTHCKPCLRGADRSPTPVEAAASPPVAERVVRSFTPSERLQRIRDYARVSRIARELDAEVVS